MVALNELEIYLCLCIVDSSLHVVSFFCKDIKVFNKILEQSRTCFTLLFLDFCRRTEEHNISNSISPDHISQFATPSKHF